MIDVIVRQARLVDAVTGEVVITDIPRPDTAQVRKDEKGWVLRWRSTYSRRTGHKLRVEHLVNGQWQ